MPLPSRRRTYAALGLLLALALLPILGIAATPPTKAQPRALATSQPTAADRPNVVLIVADDLDLAAAERMPNVANLLRDRGTSFANAFVTTPVCCPSRASILRGQYVHNHGTLTNTGRDGGFPTFRRLGREDSTLATWLDDAGYRTALFGKYLNGFPKGVDPAYVPPGWDDWYGISSRQPAYFDYQLNENGDLRSYGQDPAAYSTDVLAARLDAFVEAAASGQEPFFAYVSPLAPHWPATPAPRHADAFAGEAAPRPPSFDEADVADKPAYVGAAPSLSDDHLAQIDELHRQRLRSLLALDELVAALVATLEETGALDRTLLVFTSDNGLLAGQHRLPGGKQVPYDEAIRVPLLLRGPGVPAGRVVDPIALNVDLAPTIAELAGAEIPDFVDGRSLLPLLSSAPPPAWRQGFLVELFGVVRARNQPAPDPAEADDDGPAVPPYRALRTADALYVEYETGERELYDLRADPHQLDNLAPAADSAALAPFSARLADLAECATDACRAAEDAPAPATPVP